MGSNVPALTPAPLASNNQEERATGHMHAQPRAQNFRMIEAEPTVVGRLSFALLIIFLFIIFSRIFDVKLSYLHIPGITFRFLALFLVLTGSFVSAFRESIGRS